MPSVNGLLVTLGHNLEVVCEFQSSVGCLCQRIYQLVVKVVCEFQSYLSTFMWGAAAQVISARFGLIQVQEALAHLPYLSWYKVTPLNET